MSGSQPSSATPSGLPVFLSHLLGWYGITVLTLGQRTGLLAALRDQAGTPEDLALRAGTELRNTTAWLRAMVAAGHATYNDGTFEMSTQLNSFLGGAFPVDVAAVLEFARRTPEILPDVEAAMRAGGGVDTHRYHTVYGSFMGHINTPTYANSLVDDWIGGVPGLVDRLHAGGRIADLACADGDAALLLAHAFPKAQVVGCDLDTEALAAARDKAQRESLPNVSFTEADSHRLAASGPFDLVVCLDSWHHFGDPVAAGRGVLDALAPQGTLMLVESGFSGELGKDSASPTALIGYAAGLLYCVQESLSGGGSGLTPADGPGWVVNALKAAGFGDVNTRETRSGWRVFAAAR